MSFFGAQERFRLNSPVGYNIPKSKAMFFVNFVSRFLDSSFTHSTSFFVKSVDRLHTTYNVQEMNQYNKKRLIQTKIEYSPLNFTMYDVTDDNALKLTEAYNRFYFGDFENKDNNSWAYDVTTNNFESINSWGLKGNQVPGNGYFFDRIEVYEFYDQIYSQTNFINPKFVDVNFAPTDATTLEGNEVAISCKYEGIVIEALSQPITQQLADMFGVTYRNDAGLPSSTRVAGPVILQNYGNTVVNNILNQFGLVPTSDSILGNALIQQGLNTFGPKLNTGFGKVIFSDINSANIASSNVSSQIANGSIVNTVATGTVSKVFKNLFI